MKLNIKSNIYIDKTYKNFIDEVRNKGFKKIVLIIDKKVSRFRYILKTISLFKKKLHIKYVFLFDEPHEPTYEYLDKNINFFRKKKIYLML